MTPLPSFTKHTGPTTVAVVMLLTPIGLSGTTAAGIPEQGKPLYQKHCASCHGANLEGQPDWKKRLPNGRLPAPPHNASGHTWHHPDGTLLKIVKEGTVAIAGGDYQSDMLGFKDVLSDDEIKAILEFIKSTWPERERKHQERLSKREREAQK